MGAESKVSLLSVAGAVKADEIAAVQVAVADRRKGGATETQTQTQIQAQRAGRDFCHRCPAALTFAQQAGKQGRKARRNDIDDFVSADADENKFPGFHVDTPMTEQ